LREYESRNGCRYFAGYLGRLKPLVFEDRNAELSGSEVARWTVFAVEAPDRRPAVTVTPPSRPRAPQGLAVRARAALLEHGLDPGEDREDSIPF